MENSTGNSPLVLCNAGNSTMPFTAPPTMPLLWFFIPFKCFSLNRSGITMSDTAFPKTSSDFHPNKISACGFQKVIKPCGQMMMTASNAELRIN